MEKKMLADCKEKENATDADVKTISERNFPTSSTGKCLLACVHETMGVVRIINITWIHYTHHRHLNLFQLIKNLKINYFPLSKIKDGKPSIEGTISVARIAFAGNEKAIEMASTVMKDCAELSDTDRCELAAKIMQCGQQSAIKHGIDSKKII